MASYRLAAVFGSRPLLHPASVHLTPEAEAHGSDPILNLSSVPPTNITLNSSAVKDTLLLHNRTTEIAAVKGMEDKSQITPDSY